MYTFLGQFNAHRNILLPKIEEPVSTSEKLVREEVKKLNENSEEIKRLREQIVTKDKK